MVARKDFHDMTTISRDGRASVSASRVLVAAALYALAAALPLFAAQNCISNGDFELPYVGSGFSYNYASANNGKATGWTLNRTDRTGRVNEEQSRFQVLDLLGYHSLFLERRKNDTASVVAEAKQTFTIPAPGTYRLTLNYCKWDPVNDYGEATALAQLIHPGGIVTNSLQSFKPRSVKRGLEGVGAFMADSVALTACGAGNDYTLRLSSTETTSKNYAYCVIDNVSFTLRTLTLGANETFSTPFGLEPHDMSLGADATLTYTPTTVTAEILPGKATLAAGAKIVFDMVGATAGAYVLRTGGFVLPEGETNPLDFIDIANAGDYAVSLIEDGRTVLVSKPGAVTSATWTGGGDHAVLLDPDNWSAVPDASTFNITLGAAADWRGLGALAVSPAATIDMNGNALKLSGLTSAEFVGAAITNSASGTAAALTVDVAAGTTSENKSVAILGNVRLVKEGAGGFRASKVGQTYWGGTEVTNGVLKCGTAGYNNNPFGPMQGPTELVANGDFDADSNSSWSGATGWSQTSAAGNTWCGRQPAGSYMSSRLPVGKFAMNAANQGKGGTPVNFWQNIAIHCPGRYRYSFDHARRNTSVSHPVTLLLVHDGVEQMITNVTPMTVDTFTRTTGYVEIVEAGTYTLKFSHGVVPSGQADSYNIFDNVSLVPCMLEVRATGADAVIDMNGQIYHYYYDYVLDGAVLKNTGTDRTTVNSLIRYFSLDDDSTLQLDRSYGFFGDGNRRGDIRLGGHTLAVNIASGKTFILVNMTFDEGRVEIPVTTGKLYTGRSGTADANHEIAATNVNFSVGCALNLYAPMDVRGYEALYEGSENVGTQPLNVFGTFRPVTSNYYGCVLQDGSTLDLSGWQGAWPWSTTSAFTTGNRTVTFADGATVTVKPGAKRGGKIVSWDEKPSNFDTLTFARDESDTRRYKLVAKDDGIYAERGFVLIVR